jgi:diadenosine tetraphosphate (Ap4A) HIT family hydrolase
LIVKRAEVIRRASLSAGAAGVRDCVLCPPLRFRFNHMAELPGAGGILCGDRDFLVIPDLAPVAEGHLLLVTTAHWTCAGAFPEELWRAAERWRDQVATLYGQAYGTEDIVVLEHGPARPQGAGSCIDHAHWHLLPGVRGVRAVVEDHGLTGMRSSHRVARALHAAGRSYLLVEEGGQGRIYAAEDVPGQFLRWAAATAALGGGPGRRAQVWRWQETFGTPGNRRRFLATLETMLSVAEPAAQRPRDNHQ